MEFPLNPKQTRDYTSSDWEKFLMLMTREDWMKLFRFRDGIDALKAPMLNLNQVKLYGDVINLLSAYSPTEIILDIDKPMKTDFHQIRISLVNDMCQGKLIQDLAEAMRKCDAVSFDCTRQGTFKISLCFENIWVEGADK